MAKHQKISEERKREYRVYTVNSIFSFKTSTMATCN